MALVTVLSGWGLERYVHDLTQERHKTADAMLAAETPTKGQIDEAREARRTFGKWHGINLLQNVATLGLTLVAAAMVAHRGGQSVTTGLSQSRP